MGGDFLSAPKRRGLTSRRKGGGSEDGLPSGFSSSRRRRWTIQGPAASAKRNFCVFVCIGLAAMAFLALWRRNSSGQMAPSSVVGELPQEGFQGREGSGGPGPARPSLDTSLLELERTLSPVPLQVLPASVGWQFLNSQDSSPDHALLAMPPRDPVDALNPEERTLLFLRIQKSGSNSLSDRILPPNSFNGKSICSDHDSRSVCGYSVAVERKAHAATSKGKFQLPPAKWEAAAMDRPEGAHNDRMEKKGLNHCFCDIVMRIEHIRWMTGHANECGAFIGVSQNRLKECQRIRSSVGDEVWQDIQRTCKPLAEKLLYNEETRVSLPKCSRFSWGYGTPTRIQLSREVSTVLSPISKKKKKEKDRRKKKKRIEEMVESGELSPEEAIVEPPAGIEMHYSLQDEEIRWLRDTYNGMDFLSGHFMSDYHTVRKFPIPHAHLYLPLPLYAHFAALNLNEGRGVPSVAGASWDDSHEVSGVVTDNLAILFVKLGHKNGGFTYFTSMREPLHRVVSQWNWYAPLCPVTPAYAHPSSLQASAPIDAF